MSELAFNVNGESFEVPATVAGWRVRRLKPRGAPELVYGRDGTPLTIPIESEIDELRAEVGTAGRYRLDPINEQGRVVDDVPAAYVQVVAAEGAAIGTAVAPTVTVAATREPESVIAEAMRLNADMARQVIEKFPAMMEAAAVLIQAADGAGIVARAAIVPVRSERTDDGEDEEGDGEGEEADGEEAQRAAEPMPAPAPVMFGGLDLNALVAQVVPIVVMKLMNGSFSLPKLGALFDWRKAAEEGKAERAGEDSDGAQGAAARSAATASTSGGAHDVRVAPGGATAESKVPAAASAPNGTAAPLSPEAMARFVAIQQQLAPAELLLAMEVAKGLSDAQRQEWIGELTAMPEADVLARVRALIGGAKGGVS